MKFFETGAVFNATRYMYPETSVGKLINWIFLIVANAQISFYLIFCNFNWYFCSLHPVLIRPLTTFVDGNDKKILFSLFDLCRKNLLTLKKVKKPLLQPIVPFKTNSKHNFRAKHLSRLPLTSVHRYVSTHPFLIKIMVYWNTSVAS